ncbi:MAG: Gldg family protein [Pseudobacter sp.]|uniref:Gldg family protein n=1 Tax=Pseudobacter sp. TaxID=2045420 RepID=UPI003F803C91
MKIINKIARAELRYLFYSPVAWFVLIVFYVFAASIYFIPLATDTLLQEELLDSWPDWIGFNEGLYLHAMPPVVIKLFNNIYLFIPLLTMGIINRENTSGSIKLLYSSPVRNREIILGKYLGMVVFNILLILGFGIVLVTAGFAMENPETGWFMSVLLALFLTVNAYTAIGLFISSLTNYQIVAAAITFAVFFLLDALSGLWQQYDLIRDLTYALSIKGKLGPMTSGTLTSRDIIYFLLIIFLFLVFAMIRMKSKQESKKWTVSFAKYGLVLLIVVTLGYFSSRPGYIAYLDLTRNEISTLHPEVQDVLRQLDGSPVTVTLYTNLLQSRSMMGFPQNRNRYITDLWERYLRFYPNMKFRYEYYYDISKGDSALYKQYPGKNMDQIAALRAESLGIRLSLFKKPAEMPNIEALREEDVRILMELEYKGKKEILRAYNDGQTWPDDTHIAGSFLRLVREKEVKTTFLTGHLERSPDRFTRRDYGKFHNWKDSRESMINRGVYADTLSIADKDIPQGLDLLVVADPKSPYSQAELNRIDQYIAAGGNAIFLTEPGKQFILEPVLKKIGVQVENGTVVSPNAHESPASFVAKLTKEGNYMSSEIYWKFFQWYGRPQIYGGYALHEGGANLKAEAVDGFTITPVLTLAGSKNTWIENGVLVTDSAAPVFSPEEGDVQKDTYTLAVNLTRKVNNKEQRIIVAGDADFLSAKLIGSGRIKQGFYSWLLNNRYPVYAVKKLPEDRLYRISYNTAGIMVNIYVYLVPAVLLLAATILLVRRKRK